MQHVSSLKVITNFISSIQLILQLLRQRNSKFTNLMDGDRDVVKPSLRRIVKKICASQEKQFLNVGPKCKTLILYEYEQQNSGLEKQKETPKINFNRVRI
jgi:hypothetical protein